MKVVLINPNQHSKFPQAPIGLAILASIIKGHEEEVKIIDANALNLSEKEVAKRIIENGSDIVGLTAMSSYIDISERIAEEIKKLDNSKIIVVGGPHASVVKEKILEKNRNVDFVVFGEGEDIIVELINAIKNNGDFGEIKGICYRDGNRIITNEKRDYIRDLDSYPMPAYDLLPIDKYRPYPPHGKELPFMPIMTSRGCPFNCLFCYKDLFGRNYTTKSTEKIIKEIRYLVEEFGIKEIMFYDDTFTFKRDRIIELCDEMIKNDLVVPWSCETRVNLVDEELLKKMKEAGCYIISYGIESASQKTLDILRKGTTIEQSEKAIEMTHKVGIMTVAYFMIGNPDETKDEIKETIDFAKRLNPDFVQFSICTPIPGSDLYKMALQKGMKEGEWKSLIYVSGDSKPFILTDNMTHEELKKLYAKSYKEFYLRPKYVLKALRRIKSKGDIKININGLKMLLDMIKG
jgi:radical SAM superfamily enzyme YgiQ (UPF0313 family)